MPDAAYSAGPSPSGQRVEMGYPVFIGPLDDESWRDGVDVCFEMRHGVDFTE